MKKRYGKVPFDKFRNWAQAPLFPLLALVTSQSMPILILHPPLHLPTSSSSSPCRSSLSKFSATCTGAQIASQTWLFFVCSSLGLYIDLFFLLFLASSLSYIVIRARLSRGRLQYMCLSLHWHKIVAPHVQSLSLRLLP